jgi:hypothetical protein
MKGWERIGNEVDMTDSRGNLRKHLEGLRKKP